MLSRLLKGVPSTDLLLQIFLFKFWSERFSSYFIVLFPNKRDVTFKYISATRLYKSCFYVYFRWWSKFIAEKVLPQNVFGVSWTSLKTSKIRNRKNIVLHCLKLNVLMAFTYLGGGGGMGRFFYLQY